MANIVSVINKSMNVKRKSFAIPPAVSYPVYLIGAILIIWEIIGQAGVIDPFMFSWPSKILIQVWAFLMNGTLFQHLYVSAIEVGLGFAMALIGIPLGLILGYWKKLEYACDPIITALYTTPTVALTPLFVLWFGLDTLSKVMMVFMMSIFPILINTMAGVKTTDSSLIKAARSYGATEFQLFKEVIFPSTLSYIITGIRLAIGRALIAVVVAEMLAANKGIGYAIRHASELFRTSEYLGYVGVLMVCSIVLTILLKMMERKIAPWRQH
ncbi:ABC transporter permease [Paenibacillus alginolyticus]|uniref:ABC transporter permease n=1 Tax=Paenibacillus alginolyticus TaxID=59839 RepID=A0ABT4GH01_9BACL|nr:ABC transporter permease [Paenibacillus alginolyticus]MCY9695467.1 ABC transporter permease [Paenibacillus alginolyticus]MEC0146328.1 ABC transporter permease [Paenibacillus alginolyticus]